MTHALPGSAVSWSTARDLIRHELLPLAREGLHAAGIVAADIDRYLGVVAGRVESGLTGSQWLLNSLASMQGADTKDAIAGALAAGYGCPAMGGKARA